MRSLRTNLDSHGRLLIPALLRKELDYKPNDTFVLRNVDGELRVLKLGQVIAEAQEMFKKRTKSSKSALDEFLQLRREDFAKEEKIFSKYKSKK